MAKTRRESLRYDRSFFVDRHEVMKLTKMAKAWEFTCSFCFKKFPSAQAMGGHQNAHRHERLEERKLYIRDSIGYRKRAYILAMKEASGSYLHAAKHELGNINGPPKMLRMPFFDVFEFNAHNNNNNNYFCRSWEKKDSEAAVMMNFFPAKELSLAENVGVGGADDKGKVCMEFNGLDLKLDLTLKL
ncbi:hypothetical protein CASFOL_026151 [Castilleja foliolosa]|uniref:C2H2-type domain-containing protein n=1 Tax=Castilleja foliolosa TaxID=1961234 RepID=A0ABD3CX49_9LAMI